MGDYLPYWPLGDLPRCTWDPPYHHVHPLTHGPATMVVPGYCTFWHGVGYSMGHLRSIIKVWGDLRQMCLKNQGCDLFSSVISPLDDDCMRRWFTTACNRRVAAQKGVRNVLKVALSGSEYQVMGAMHAEWNRVCMQSSCSVDNQGHYFQFQDSGRLLHDINSSCRSPSHSNRNWTIKLLIINRTDQSKALREGFLGFL